MWPSWAALISDFSTARPVKVVGFTASGLPIHREATGEGLLSHLVIRALDGGNPEAARQAGLSVMAHAGEVMGPASVWGAIDVLGCARIGHGIRSIDDPARRAQ